ncbi:MAG: type II toxin-antitoxin system VapC family toxin [Acidobacteria bacterium]|nr:type II toxin-antitoxin system VapC family toxin [Acidobacteriota bacterium]MBI3661632.1 type II toxin-antitoxin system VapC family toxin [Acidobacteriota bacterium]
MKAYADTSFLVSLYTPDVNSAQAATVMNRVVLPALSTSLGELELINALHLRLFRKELRSKEVRAARAAFRKDLETGIYALEPLSAAVFVLARRISQKRTPRLGTRTFDILHVAAAVVLRADTFLTFDTRQERLAKAEGLRTL